MTERQLQQAIQHQVLYGGRLGTNLYELGFISEERLQEALAKAHGIRGPHHVDVRQIEPDAVALLPRALAMQYRVCPYKVKGRTLFLLMLDPADHHTLAKISFSLGYIVKPLVIPEFRMIQVLRDFYGIDERWRYDEHSRPPAAKPRPAPPLDVKAAGEQIDGATSRDEVVSAIMAVCGASYRRVIFFIVRPPWLIGWTSAGEGVQPVASWRIPLHEPSVFQTVVRDKTVFIGRLGSEQENQRFLEALGKKSNTNAVLLPVVVRGRAVNLVYVDNGNTGNVRATLGELLVLMQKVPRAYLRIIRKRVAETRKATGGIPGQEVK